MLRTELDADAPAVSLVLGFGRVRWMQRLAASRGTTSKTIGSYENPQVRLRLERRGGEFRALFSSDGGATWTAAEPVTPAPAFPEELHVGVAAAGKSPSAIARARICELEISAPDPLFLRGEANGDEARDLSDAVFVLRHLFQGETAPSCQKAADSNDDGAVELSDAVYLLAYLFQGGSPPASPEVCGSTIGPETLDCGREACVGF
jgi:hypothetical protein